ncbi:MAG: VWA domain-containing protein [Isosphaeraceae bacterium]
MRLAEPAWLILMVLGVVPWLWEWARPRVVWPSLDGFAQAPRGLVVRLRRVPTACRALAVVALAVALARPQSIGGQTRIKGRGVAIVAAIDNSGSMRLGYRVPDSLPITRLDAAKQTFAQFVQGRPNDLIGLATFANYADLSCPPTLDHRFVLESVQTLKPARPGDDGTNLGEAIAVALKALRPTSPKKKVLILLTDGRNRPAVPDPIDPNEMARLAKDLGVTLHAIAIGRGGGLDRPVESVTGLPLPAEDTSPDFALLQTLADLGGGRLFAADDAQSLARVFKTIDRLETSPVTGTIRTRYREEFPPWVVGALALLVLDRLLSSGRLRRLP